MSIEQWATFDLIVWNWHRVQCELSIQAFLDQRAGNMWARLDTSKTLENHELSALQTTSEIVFRNSISLKVQQDVDNLSKKKKCSALHWVVQCVLGTDNISSRRGSKSILKTNSEDILLQQIYKVFVPSLSVAEKPTNRKWKKSHLFQVNYRVLKL